MQEFTFADLSPDDILKGLRAVNIPATMAHLETPKPATIIPVYRQYLMILASFESEAQLTHPHLRRRNVVDEELQSGFIFLNFFENMCLLMDSAGVPDFSLDDLLRPSPERVQHNLSGLINFAIFREERLVRFQEMQEHWNQIIRENQMMAQELRNLSEQEQQFMSERTQIDQLENRKRSFETELSECETAIANIQDTIEKRERDERRLQAELDQMRRSYERIKQDLAAVKVHAGLRPQEIIGELRDAEARLEAAKRQTTEEQDTFRECQRRHAALTDVRMKFISAVETAYQVAQEWKRCGDVSTLRDRLEESKKELAQKRAQVQRMRQEKATKSMAKRKATDQERELQNAIARQQEALAAIEEQGTRELGDVSDRIEGVKEQIHEYMQQLAAAMEAATFRRLASQKAD
jgi:kinetochore protein Nuf2